MWIVIASCVLTMKTLENLLYDDLYDDDFNPEGRQLYDTY